MTREEQVEEHKSEITRHLALRYWKPPDGVRYRPRVAFYSRWTAIEVLEHALSGRRGKNVTRDTSDDSLENDLMMFYRDLDGRFDHLPLRLSHAPKILDLLLPEMLLEELRRWVDESPIMDTGLENSIMADWLRELTGLKAEQLVLGRKAARLVVPDVAADSQCIYLLGLPDWLQEVNRLMLMDWRPGGLMNVRQLREHLIREIRNSTCDIGNSLYI